MIDYKKDIKFIYTDRWFHKESNTLKHFPNAAHPIILNYLKDCFENEKNCTEFIYNGYDVLKFCLFEFYKFLEEKYKDKIISIDEIEDDNSIYIYPVEIRFNIKHLNEPIEFTYKNNKYLWNFIDVIPEKIINLLKLGKVKLLLSMTHDPVSTTKDIVEFLKILKEKNISYKDVIFVGGSKIKNWENLPNDFNLYHAFIFIKSYIRNKPIEKSYGSLGYESQWVSEKDLNERIERKYKFISFNRAMQKSHRAIFGYIYEKYNLENHGIFSFLQGDEESKIKIAQIIRQNYKNADSSIIENFVGKLPIEVDTQHLSPQEKMGFATDLNKLDFYKESYINIVTETTFNNEVFLSEKIMRPLANYQPFLVFASVGTLEELKSLGFKTFNPIINEEYDTIENMDERFASLEKEIDRLNKMTIGEIHNLYYSIKDILIHNRNILEKLIDYECFSDVLEKIKIVYK